MRTPNNIKVRRLAIGMNPQTLAEKVGVSTSTIYHIENSSADYVSFSLIQRLTTALKCNSVRDLFPGTMCPEVSQKDLRAHKRSHRNGAEYNEIVIDEDATKEFALRVGDVVTVNEFSLHEKPFNGEVLEVSDRMFVVRHPKGWKECFRWDELDGCKVRKYKEGWEVGQP